MSQPSGTVHGMPRPRHSHEAESFARELRKDMPWSEARLWMAIRNKATGARFRRQVPIGRWIVDFASLRPKIAIEIDGDSHYDHDETERTTHIESQGFTILRFANEDVLQDVGGVIDTISAAVERLRN